MNRHIVVKATHSVLAGKVADFEDLASEMIDVVETGEPGYLSYQWYLSEDNGTCTIVGVLQDSEAVLNHLANISEMIGPLSEVAPATGIELYGDLSNELQEAVTPFGAKISGHWKGFTR